LPSKVKCNTGFDWLIDQKAQLNHIQWVHVNVRSTVEI
jgi:hypothetical protein